MIPNIWQVYITTVHFHTDGMFISCSKTRKSCDWSCAPCRWRGHRVEDTMVQDKSNWLPECPLESWKLGKKSIPVFYLREGLEAQLLSPVMESMATDQDVHTDYIKEDAMWSASKLIDVRWAEPSKAPKTSPVLPRMSRWIISSLWRRTLFRR